MCCVDWVAWSPLSGMFGEWAPRLNHRLDDFEKEQDEHDGENETEATSTVVSETWTHAVTTEAEQQNQDDQKDEHFYFLRSGNS
jgi:hypothetical protein